MPRLKTAIQGGWAAAYLTCPDCGGEMVGSRGSFMIDQQDCIPPSAGGPRPTVTCNNCGVQAFIPRAVRTALS